MKLALFSLCFIMVLIGCNDSERMEYEMYLVNGEAIYKENCQNCHGTNGEGLRNLYPPLVNNSHLENLNSVICIIKNGASGEMEINGKIYDQAMPSNSRMFDLDMAQLITFLNKEFREVEEKVDVNQVKEALANCK